MLKYRELIALTLLGLALLDLRYQLAQANMARPRPVPIRDGLLPEPAGAAEDRELTISDYCRYFLDGKEVTAEVFHTKQRRVDLLNTNAIGEVIRIQANTKE